MPSNILNADIGFPDNDPRKPDAQKLNEIYNYLFMLLEQLRYSLGNLSKENFNETGLEEIETIFTKPIYVKLANDEEEIAEIKVDASAITVRMGNAEGDISVLQQTATGLTTRVSTAEGDISVLQQTATGITTRVSTAEGDISVLQQTADGLRTDVNAASGAASVAQQTADAIKAQVTDSDGNYTVLNLKSDGLHIGNADGTTKISGSNLTTGSVTATQIASATITANEIAGSTITAAEIASGAITSGKIASGAVTTAKLDAGAVTTAKLDAGAVTTAKLDAGAVTTAKLDAGAVTAAKIASGAITADMISAGTLNAGVINLLDTFNVQVEVPTYDSRGRQTGTEIQDCGIIGGRGFTINGIQYPTGVSVLGRDAPAQIGGRYVLVGASASAIIAASYSITIAADDINMNGTINYSSDRNLKTDISYDTEKLIALFDLLKPATFRMVGDPNKDHMGFIAQDVETAAITAGFQDALVTEGQVDGKTIKFLSYNQMLAPLCAKIQQLDKRVAELEGRINHAAT